MLDEVFQAGTDKSLDQMQRLPALPPQLRDPSFASQAGEFLAAPFKGFAQAVNESLRAANRGLGGGVAPGLTFRATGQVDVEALMRAKADAVETQTAIDEALRSGANFWAPDPETATAASRTVQGVSRFLTKAAAYTIAAGPAGGAALTGLDEGITASAELTDAGVDPLTAAKVGAVRGLSAGVAVAIPAFGATKLATGALAVAGGPVQYIAENAAARKILQDADYTREAAQFDPFDPVGLSVATIFPALFGFGLYAARARAGRVPAQSEVDAARTVLAREAADGAALANPVNIEGQTAHVAALDSTAQQMARGQTPAVPPAAIAALDETGAARLADMADRLRSAVDEVRNDPSFRTAPEPKLVPRTIADPQIDAALTRARGISEEVRAGKVPEGTPPEVSNLALGLAEFKGREDALLMRVNAFRAADRGAPLPNVVADAIDSLRTDSAGANVPKPEQMVTPDPASEIVAQRPDMAVEVEGADGAPVRMSAREAMEHAAQTARNEAADADLIGIAAACFVGVG
jgi:hypothetical protein